MDVRTERLINMLLGGKEKMDWAGGVPKFGEPQVSNTPMGGPVENAWMMYKPIVHPSERPDELRRLVELLAEAKQPGNERIDDAFNQFAEY